MYQENEEDTLAEERLDRVFYASYESNHPVFKDWLSVKYMLKKLRESNKELAEDIKTVETYYKDKIYKLQQ